MNEMMNTALKHAQRLVVGIVGATILLIGIAMIVLPGPALVVIPIGLAVLGTEFLWARRLLKRVKSGAADAFRTLRQRNAETKKQPEE